MVLWTLMVIEPELGGRLRPLSEQGGYAPSNSPAEPPPFGCADKAGARTRNTKVGATIISVQAPPPPSPNLHGHHGHRGNSFFAAEQPQMLRALRFDADAVDID